MGASRWGQASRKAIAITFDMGVDVHEIVAWAETENLRGVNVTCLSLNS